jgi:Fe2+ transport system protein FeoA
VTLWHLPRSRKARVIGTAPRLAHAYRLRLEELGFRKGGEVTCLRKTPFGSPRIYLVGDSVFSIARDVAEQIEIETVSG